jgi:hypothetical protein
MAYWWDGDADERYWVEIRGIPGIGTSLDCPDHRINSDGSHGRNTWYELVHSVRKGDVVVDLEDFRPITASVDLAYMRGRSASLYRLRRQLQAGPC